MLSEWAVMMVSCFALAAGAAELEDPRTIRKTNGVISTNAKRMSK